MVTLRSSQTLETQENPNTHKIHENGQTQIEETQKKSGYEQYREQRIKENRERMEKLGIFDLSLRLKSVKPTRNYNSSNRESTKCLSPLLPPSGPTRRSSRLQNVTPISYSEVQRSSKDTSLEDERDLLGEGSRPEVYTDKHEKLLGNTERSWTLFVDGVGRDGKRIYDPVNGKTCHQCRQKTLGHRTHCSKCGMVQGQFCGDCLYMRYGEHVLEANQNPDWICPVCRGICNCSLCRQAKGWPPTGPLYRKICKLGFKSVAHYLIQTQRQPNSDKDPGTKLPASAKKSLLFSDVEATSNGSKSPICNDDHLSLVTPEHEENKRDDELKCGTNEEMGFAENEYGGTDIVAKSSQEPGEKSAPISESESSSLEAEGKKEEKLQDMDYKHCNKLQDMDYKHSDNHVALESSPKLKRKSLHKIAEPNPDSIGGRLRQRRRTVNGQI